MTQEYADIRREYKQDSLVEEQLTSSPITLFEQWFAEYKALESTDPTAMVVSSVNAHHRPSQRIVLLKGVSESGFRFFTNTDSQKRQDIQGNSAVSLLFPWHEMERQVIISGDAIALDRSEVESYFATRPRASQLGALASDQSRPIESRQALDRRYDDLDSQYPQDVPFPHHWGGYCVSPVRIEFWQGGARRLHDRLVYTKGQSGDWTTQRLMP